MADEVNAFGAGASPSLPSPPAPEQAERAERLLREAHLARTRGQPAEVERLLTEALAVAPGLSSVHEALGDAYLAARETRKARDAFQTAVRLDPSNVSAERKFGETVLAVQLALDPASILGGDESYASGRAAALMSFFLPGLGHLALGQQRLGAGLIAVWIASIVLAFVIPDGLSGFASAFGRPGPPFNALVLLPLTTAAATWLYAVATTNAAAKRSTLRPPNRPLPPVDKDFEL